MTIFIVESVYIKKIIKQQSVGYSSKKIYFATKRNKFGGVECPPDFFSFCYI